MKYKGILASSSDSSGQTLSTTIDGLITVLSAVVPLVALQFFHVNIQASDVASLVTEAGTVIGGIVAIRGLVLKIVNTWGTTS